MKGFSPTLVETAYTNLYAIHQRLPAGGYPLVHALLMRWPSDRTGEPFAYKLLFRTRTDDRFTFIVPLNTPPDDVIARYHEHLIDWSSDL